MCPYYLDGDLSCFEFGPKTELGEHPSSSPLIVGDDCGLCSFQGSLGGAPRVSRVGLSKLNSMQPARGPARPGSVDVLAARSVAAPSPRGVIATGSEAGAVPDVPLAGLPRKEVIQPQLPLRLPCYDFTPVTSPTFDGSLPCGLGHRLRVLLTPVV